MMGFRDFLKNNKVFGTTDVNEFFSSWFSNLKISDNKDEQKKYLTWLSSGFKFLFGYEIYVNDSITFLKNDIWGNTEDIKINFE